LTNPPALAFPIRPAFISINNGAYGTVAICRPIGKRIKRRIVKTRAAEPVATLRSEIQLDRFLAALPIQGVQVQIAEGRKIAEILAPVQTCGNRDEHKQSGAQQEFKPSRRGYRNQPE
jgi:hypothetical protein